MSQNDVNNGAQNVFDFLVDDGRGGDERLDSSVIAFPFIRLLQTISPQCKKKDPAYVEGAEEGMLYNNVTNEVINLPTRVIVGMFDRTYVEWKPNRGGFAGAHTPEQVNKGLTTGNYDTVNNKIIDPLTGNELTDTYTYYVYLPDKPEWGVCLLCMSGTQLKEARRWNRLLTSMVIPGTKTRAKIYHTVWKLDSVQLSNEKGSWVGYAVSFDSWIDKAMFETITTERAALSDGRQVNYAALAEGSDSAESLPQGAIDVTPSDAAMEDAPF